MRNEERLGPTPNQAPDPAAEAQMSILSFPQPTQIVSLPSEGKFYPEGSYLRGKETIEIRFMTAKEEDILTSRTLLLKGVAIDRLLSQLILDSAVKIDDLLLGDKNALLLAARKSGFGSAYDTKIRCPICEETFQKKLDLDEIEQIHRAEIPEGVEVLPNGNFAAILPLTKLRTEFRLLFSRDARTMQLEAENKKKLHLAETGVTDLLRTVIVSLGGATDNVASLVQQLPTRDVRFFLDIYKKVKPDVELIAKSITCEKCESVLEEVQVSITTEFFWPK